MSLNRTLAGLIDTAGDVKSASLDNAASLTVYATKEDLPSSGMSSGDQAYVTGNSRFYISNGSGWYNVALINATPALSISPTGEILLDADNLTSTTITLTATDSDNAVAGLTYSVESDGSFAGLYQTESGQESHCGGCVYHLRVARKSAASVLLE